jgi:HlyD family secretion protein
VGLAQLLVAGGLVAWALVWPVPTEVSGEGVLLPPGNAGVLNARAGGQIRSVAVQVGSRVRPGQVLM